jgi:hypothetical protein
VRGFHHGLALESTWQPIRPARPCILWLDSQVSNRVRKISPGTRKIRAKPRVFGHLRATPGPAQNPILLQLQSDIEFRTRNRIDPKNNGQQSSTAEWKILAGRQNPDRRGWKIRAALTLSDAQPRWQAQIQSSE